MSDLVANTVLPRMTYREQELGKALVLETLKHEEAEIPIEHFIHAGVYVRTCFLKKGTIGAGAFIKIPTVVIVQGKCLVVVGDTLESIDGYKVLRGLDGRRQVFRAIEDTYITMLFATKSSTVEDAEKEFTDEWKLLTTRRDELCQA